MKKDKIHYAYLRMIIEERQSLLESEHWWNNNDHMFHHANLMAHDGSSVHEIHQHLKDVHGESYYATSMMDWFSRGGGNPTNQYIRKLVHVAYNKPVGVHVPHIEENVVHDNLIHPDAVQWFHNILYKHTQLKLLHLPEHIKVYRGVGFEHDTETYKPHALESWTTHLPTAVAFSSDKQSRVSGGIPHVFEATAHKSCILMCHVAKLPSMPTEDSLEGKEEYTMIGHKLQNIVRIK